MEFEKGFRYDTRFSPPFGLGGFSQWKVRVKIFLMMDINNWFILVEELETPIDSKDKLLKKKKQIERQTQKSKTNNIVTKILTNLVSNVIVCKLGKYKDACDLWCKLVKFHEDYPQHKMKTSTRRDVH